MRRFLIIFSFFIIAAGATTYALRAEIRENFEEFLAPPLPKPKTAQEFAKPQNSKKQERPAEQAKQTKQESKKILKRVQDDTLPAEINLNIPFASQAPFNNWELPFKEACEEAAVIMAHKFLIGESLTQQIMKDEILKLVEWEKQRFGYYEDTTAEEMAATLREFYGHANIEVKENFSIEDIKREVAAGHPVILPAAGRLLPNPNFRQPGPVYHALVVKGYTKTKIITNDPGTRNGKDFLYDPNALMKAVHDWSFPDILNGRKVMIVVKPG